MRAFGSTQPPSVNTCHCEERSDEAIPLKQRDCFVGLRPTRNDVYKKFAFGVYCFNWVSKGT